MREYLSYDRIANAICQDTTFSGIYILVEGSNDYVLYRKFINHNAHEFQVLLGKRLVIDVLTELGARGFTKAIGVVDSDFDNLNMTAASIPNLFFTDSHDSEMMIIQSETMNVLVDLHCSKDKLEALRKEAGNIVIAEYLLNILLPLSYLKWANCIHNWGLTFKPKDESSPKLKIENFIDTKTLVYQGHNKLIDTVLNFSRGKSEFSVTAAEILEQLVNLMKRQVEVHQISNGHDFCYLFAMSLRRKLANRNSTSLSQEEIEEDLILAYDSIYFGETNLFAQLKQWEIKNEVPLLKL